MYKTEYKTYMKEVKEEIATKMFCDFCEKEIHNGDKYLNVTSSHNDWGNDSIDSWKSADVHEECLQEYLKWLFSKDSIISSLHNRNDWKIEIDTEWCDVPSIMVGSDKEC